jgi:TatA/E family protein of Tat protein translocase
MIFTFFNLGFGELFAIFVVVLLLFGADKIPEFARSLGKGIRYVKDATDGVKRDIQSSVDEVKSDMDENIKEVKKNVDVLNSVKHKTNKRVKNVFDEITDSVGDIADKAMTDDSKPKITKS